MKTLTQDDIRHNTKLLIQASENGDVDDVRRLIPVSRPKSNDSEALRVAAHNGHTEIIKLLIPVSDPKAKNSQALGDAAANKQHIDEYEALMQKERLTKEIKSWNEYKHDNIQKRKM